MVDQATIVASLRTDRDRFVAFSFAAADALVELDADRKVSYAVGAIHWLSGKSAETIIGVSFLDVVAKADRRMIQAAFTTAETQHRFGPINIRLTGSGGREQRVALFGSYLPDRANRLFLALSSHRVAPVTAVRENVSRDEATGLLDKQSFSDLTLETMQSGDPDNPYKMTLLNVEGLDELQERLDDAAAHEFVSDISAHLQVHSVNGEAAGRLEDNQFGLVHEGFLDVSALEQTIAERAQEVDPTGAGVTVGGTTLTLEAGGVTPEDSARALLYTINRFSDEHGDFTIGALSQEYKLMLDDTVERVAEFKSLIASASFDVVFQPIVELKSRKVHHSEALVRFQGDAHAGTSPFKMITFAEEVGVIGDFDLAMCRKVIDKIRHARAQGDALHIAVNLSGRSLESPGFVGAFFDLLRSCDSIREQLMFEVTESAKITELEATNNILHELRSKGHHVCLDDFGAGASAFQYLRALDIDFVKIDGVYVREALTKPNGKPFLRAMATLCADLGIETIGEMVEDEDVAQFLVEAGVRYGQGYLFGKPSMGVSGSRLPPSS